MPDSPKIDLLRVALGEGCTADEAAAWLDETLAAARAAWPGVLVAVDDFVGVLVARAESGEALRGLHLSDLYLAAACARGSTQGLMAFDATFAAEIAAVVRRVSRSVDVEELIQALRETLFVGRHGSAPKVGEYSGRGELRAWLRVVATRAALNAATRGPKEKPAADDEQLIEAAGGAADAEVAYFRIHYEAELKRALPDALAELTPRERLLLRQHYIDELTLEAMARVHAVHLATVKRHLASAKEALTEKIRLRLCERLRLSPSELQSVLAVVRSQLHVTMRRLLPKESEEEA